VGINEYQIGLLSTHEPKSQKGGGADKPGTTKVPVQKLSNR